jgi:hypothetical protein
MVKKETKTLPFETHRNTSDESRSEEGINYLRLPKSSP